MKENNQVVLPPMKEKSEDTLLKIVLLLIGGAISMFKSASLGFILLGIAGVLSWHRLLTKEWPIAQRIKGIPRAGLVGDILIVLLGGGLAIRSHLAHPESTRTQPTPAPAVNTQHNEGSSGINVQASGPVTINQSDPNQHRLRDVPVDPKTGHTPLFAETERKVDERRKRLIGEHVIPWETVRKVVLYDGGEFDYNGLEYSGTAIDIFWESVDPFLEDAIKEVLDEVGQECQSHGLNPRAALKEAGWLLESMVREVYRKMTDVDQRLRGKGFPKSVQKVDKKFELERMIAKVQPYVEAATLRYSRLPN
jgi:hypothetical protein